VATALLDGTRVVDLAGEPAALTGRILADLGAAVVLVEPAGGHPLRSDPDRFAAWSAGKTSVTAERADDPTLLGLIAAADVVITTPGFPGTLDVDPGTGPHAVWVSITPFGGTGPRSGWIANDLGVMAASANMYSTGDPDRAPVRCTEPSGYAHTGPEAAFAALTALWTGRPQRVDVSMQEVAFVANMGAPARYLTTGFRGVRRGANIGRTREIWPTKDGFVSFGLRGGKARVPSLELITRLVREAGVDASALEAQDWSGWAPNTADEPILRAIEVPIAEYFARHTMQELYDIACETNLMLAPANSPREILASRQLEARGFFSTLGDIERLPASFVQVRASDGTVTPVAPDRAAPPAPTSVPVVDWSPRQPVNAPPVTSAGPAWTGTNILEFGSGAAGPIATRYFAEHGAIVLRVESRSRPDFLRVYALGPDNPHGLEGAPMYDALNVGKRNVALNLKHPDAVGLVRRLVCEWADAVAENFAPRAMKGFGLDYDSLAVLKPDLVMISACLNGQTGPHKDYPGFGGQGAALSGFNWLTGWPDREPLGPHGTITDSLAPRFVATALAAGLEYRRRTGSGVYLDVAQVETGVFALSPWLLAFQRDGTVGVRDGNRSRHAVPHGAFPCAAEDQRGDRWVAIAAWNDEQWARLAALIGVDDPGLATLPDRLRRVDNVEAAVGAWTATRSRAEVCEQLQAAGIEAVGVADFGDVHDDPQVACREHFVPLVHPVMGPGLYERNGFRLSDAPSGYDRSGPTLGQDNDWVLGQILGLSVAEQQRLREAGAVE
jgi:crotonobetainyl-CoA:carnitine CoA-transferase CaiB-like acyl-CoA transferase